MLDFHAVLRFARHTAPVLALGLAATSSLSAQQMIGPVTIETGGLPIQVRPTLNIERLATGNVRVTLSSFNAIPDRNTGILVNGRRYNALSFNTALAPYFNAIRVTGISAAIEFSGVQGCTRASDSEWSDGESLTLTGCGSAPGEPRLERYIISRLSTEGLSALQQRVRELIAEEQAKAKQTASAPATTAPTTTAPAATAKTGAVSAAAGAASAGSAATASAPTATRAPSTSTTTSTATAEQRAAQERELERQRQLEASRREMARLQAEQARLADEMAGATLAVAGSVMELSRQFAANRERKARAEARAAAEAAERARLAELAYQRTIAERFASVPEWRTCRESDIVRLDATQTVERATSLSMQSCRNTDGKALAIIDVVPATDGRWTRIETYGMARGFVSAHAPIEASDAERFSKQRRGGLIHNLPPGSPTHRVLLTTEFQGEVVPYRVAVVPLTRSTVSASRWMVNLAFGSASEQRGGSDELSSAVFAAQVGYRLLGGLFAVSELGMGVEATNEFFLGARYVAGRDSWAVRPFVQYDFLGADDGDLAATSTGYSAGVHWIPTLGFNEAAITLEWVSRSGEVSEVFRGSDAYTFSGLRMGFTYFPIAPRR